MLDISVLNWLAFFLVNAFLMTAAYCVSSKMTSHSLFSATLAATLMVYLAQATVIVLLFGVVLKTLNATAIGAFTLLVAGAQIVLYWHERKPLLVSMFQGLRRCFLSGDIWLLIVCVLLLLQVCLNLYKVSFMPVHIFDSLVYRAPPAPIWFQLGWIPPLLDNVPVNDINGKSLGIAVLMLWFFVFLGDSLLVNLPQFITSLALLLVVYAAARQCGSTSGWALKMAALVYFVPGILIESVSTQDHLAVNVAFVALLFFMRELSLYPSKVLMPLLGVLLGLMFSFKQNAVVYFPVLALAAVYLLWINRRYWYKKQGMISAFLRQLGVVCLIAFVVGGYWTAKNLIVHGDAFGMSFNKVNTGAISHVLSENNERVVEAIEEKADKRPETTYQSEHTNVLTAFLHLHTLYSNVQSLPQRLLDGGRDSAMYMGNFSNISAFGPQFFVFGIGSILLVSLSLIMPSLRVNGRFYVLMGTAMLLVYFCVMSNVYAYRNFLFFPPLVLLLMAVFFSEKIKLTSWARFTVNAVIMLCLLWSAWHILPPMYANPHTLKAFVSLERHYQSGGRYSRLYSPSPKIYRMLDEMPPNEPVFYVNADRRNTWIYENYDVKWHRRVEYIPLLARYFECEPSYYCRPSSAFKALLREKKGHVVNMCVFEHCLWIRDPDFLEIGAGLYYYMGGQPT